MQNKPLIAILMAVYEPRLDWLGEQLTSLEAQDYPNLRLYVRDDCSQTVSFQAIKTTVQNNIRSFPYEVLRNAKNIGSNLTFQRLTEEAEGAYFAYCDQDDVWLPEKLTVLQEELNRTGSLLACSDMFIINADGKEIADSITRVRKRHKFRSGHGLVGALLIHNFATGCACLVKAQTAKDALPFCPYMVHDHYIALYCAEKGAIQSVARPLIRYRIHESNQTSLLSGVTDKTSYGAVRIKGMKKRLTWLKEHFLCGEQTKTLIKDALVWCEARERNWEHRGGKRQIWRYRRFSPQSSVYEILASKMPDSLFKLCIKAAKRNII